jgi:hypothetical protein
VNYPTCRTCKHFTEGGKFVDPYGYCARIQDDDRMQEPAYVIGCHEDAAIFHPRPDFGCLLHEPLTEEKEG